MPRRDGEIGLEAFVDGVGGDDEHRPLKRPVTTGAARIGTVKTFNTANNYGFLDCPELKEEFGMDVYCPGEYLKDKWKGQKVMFEVSINKRGQPQAVDVRVVDIETVPSEPVFKAPKLSWPTFETMQSLSS